MVSLETRKRGKERKKKTRSRERVEFFFNALLLTRTYTLRHASTIVNHLPVLTITDNAGILNFIPKERNTSLPPRIVHAAFSRTMPLWIFLCHPAVKRAAADSPLLFLFFSSLCLSSPPPPPSRFKSARSKGYACIRVSKDFPLNFL